MFDIDITPEWDRVEVSEPTLEVLELRRALAELRDGTHGQTRPAVAELRRAGLTIRDVARPLGVTPWRVSQIEKEGSEQDARDRALGPCSRPLQERMLAADDRRRALA